MTVLTMLVAGLKIHYDYAILMACRPAASAACQGLSSQFHIDWHLGNGIRVAMLAARCCSLCSPGRQCSPGNWRTARTFTPGPRAIANWLLVEDDGDQLAVTHRRVPYDAGAVAADLRHRRHPNSEFITSILTGARQL